MKNILAKIIILMLIMTSIIFSTSNLTIAQGTKVSPSKIVTEQDIVAEKSNQSKNQTAQITEKADEVIEKLRQIEQFKEKIATKVAELREKDKGGISGVVKKITDSKISLETKTGEQNLSYSEDIIFYSLKDGKKSESDIEKIKVGDLIAAFGYYNETKEAFSAKYIYVEESLEHLIGKIVDIDKANFTITVKSKDGQKVVDIEKYTKMSVYSKDKGLVRSGFSKLKLTDVAHIMGKINEKEENRIAAERVLTLSLGETQQEASPSPSITSKE